MGFDWRGGRLVVAAALLVVSSCATGEWTGDPQAASVVVLGDSLVFQSEQSLNGTETWITDDLVANGLYGWVTGHTGLKVADAYPAVWNTPSRQGLIPDVLVIALGTNDMHVDDATGQPPTTPEAARPLLRAWMAEVPAGCVKLIGPAESITGWGLDVTAPAWNVMLAEEAALHANATYVPWDPLLAWTENGANPHMTQAGRDAYRALIVAEALDCLA